MMKMLKVIIKYFGNTSKDFLFDLFIIDPELSALFFPLNSESYNVLQFFRLNCYVGF